MLGRHRYRFLSLPSLAALLILSFAAVAVPNQVASQEFEIVYLEGAAYTRSGGSWEPVEVGNTLRNEAILRLENEAYVEVGHRQGILRIARPGTYRLDVLRSSTNRARSESIQQAISARYRRLLAERFEAAEEGQDGEISERQERDLSLLRNGLRALDRNEGEGAYQLFREAMATTGPEERADLIVLQALAARAAGRPYEALRLLDTGEGILYDEKVLLKAELLLDLSAFAESTEMAERYLQAAPRTPSERQVATVLKAQALVGMGNLGAAFATFEDAISLDPISEIGRAAREQLEALR